MRGRTTGNSPIKSVHFPIISPPSGIGDRSYGSHAGTSSALLLLTFTSATSNVNVNVDDALSSANRRTGDLAPGSHRGLRRRDDAIVRNRRPIVRGPHRGVVNVNVGINVDEVLSPATRRMGGRAPGKSPIRMRTFSYYFCHRPESATHRTGATQGRRQR